jgi:hypothetical protein
VRANRPDDSREEPANGGSTRTRFSFSTLLRVLLPSVAATAVVLFFFARSPAAKEKARPDGMRSITLSQKDSTFAPIPPSAGGASAEILYAPRGPGLHFVLHASGLKPGRRYLLELQVDDAIYTIATYSPSARGELIIDTTLTQFAEGVCVGTNFDPPRPTAGHHRVKFWVKHDGNPATGTMPDIAPTAPGAQLACHGNGDGDFGYVLLENKVADFTGTNASAHDSSR